MKISYAITVCNEFVEIQRLLGFLLKNKRDQDEIVILFDTNNGTKEVEQVLDHYNSIFKYYTLRKSTFSNHFADWKNKLTSFCTGDYIFQIDADEIPTTYMMDMLPEVLKHNEVDVFKVPRINTVNGLTKQHIEKWNWGVNDQGWVNFPDFQWRIYKNDNKIKWVNRVHEVLQGYHTMSYLPTEEQWCLRHDKTIDRQEKQNELYKEL